MPPGRVLISGASRGLGREFARQYAEDDWEVIAGVRDVRTETPEAGSGRIRWRRLDVCDPASIASLARDQDGLGLDVLVNNAALRGDTRGLDGLAPADFHAVMATNVLGPLLMVKAFLPHLGRAGRAVVANIGSRAGSMAEGADPDQDYAYRCSKAALNMVTATLARDLPGLIVLSLHPGWAKTDMGGPDAEVAVADSVAGLRAAIAAAGPADSGTFRSYDGASIAW